MGSEFMSFYRRLIRVPVVVVLSMLVGNVSSASENWTQFRGTANDGRSDSKDLPTTWSEAENIKWKTVIPGEGWSSPVVFGEQVWMTTSLQNGASLRAVCVDRGSGKIVHDVEVFHVANPEKKHTFNSYASPTPILEAGRVYVCFGDNGSACLDSATAKPIWINRELTLDHMNGPGSSPIIFKNLYILCCDGIDVQYVAALDKNTGKLVWKTDRSVSFDGVPPDVRKAYNTPIVIDSEGHFQLISIGAHRVYSYDVMTGRELWYFDQPGFSCVAQPQFADGMLYLSTGFTKAELWAVRTDGAGDVTKTHIAWKLKKGVPCRSSPLLVGQGNDLRIYMVTDDGIARCVRASDGEVLSQARVGVGFSASPLEAEGHVYFFDQKNVSKVMKADDKMTLIAENYLDDGCMGTPAIAGRAIFLRSKTHLYRIEK
jgi:outer membrane protein assembly factor BamB